MFFFNKQNFYQEIKTFAVGIFKILKNKNWWYTFHFPYREKRIIFCFWAKAYNSWLTWLSKQQNVKSSEIPLLSSNSIQNFKQIEQKTPEILQFYFFSLSCRIASVTLYFCQNEARNLQNGDFHLSQIPDFKMWYLENHSAHFFLIFHASSFELDLFFYFFGWSRPLRVVVFRVNHETTITLSMTPSSLLGF